MYKMTVIYHMPDVKQMSVSDQNRPPFPVNGTKITVKDHMTTS